MIAQRTAPHHRLLVEDTTGELAGADFSLFRAAGFDVTFCAHSRDDGCHGVDDADIVLFNLDADDEADHRALRALRRRYPDTPVVVRLPSNGSPLGCRTLAVPVSMDGRARALGAAVSSRRRAG